MGVCGYHICVKAAINLLHTCETASVKFSVLVFKKSNTCEHASEFNTTDGVLTDTRIYSEHLQFIEIKVIYRRRPEAIIIDDKHSRMHVVSFRLLHCPRGVQVDVWLSTLDENQKP